MSFGQDERRSTSLREESSPSVRENSESPFSFGIERRRVYYNIRMACGTLALGNQNREQGFLCQAMKEWYSTERKVVSHILHGCLLCALYLSTGILFHWWCGGFNHRTAGMAVVPVFETIRGIMMRRPAGADRKNGRSPMPANVSCLTICVSKEGSL